MRLAIAACLLLILAACGSDPDEPPATADTKTVTAEPTPAAETPAYEPLYPEVADYLNANLPESHPLKGQFFNTNAELDGSLGAVCDEVDGRPVRSRFRNEFADGMSQWNNSDPDVAVPSFTRKDALVVFDVIVAGCYDTGYAERYVKPVPTITDGAWTVGVDFPGGTYRSDGDFDQCYWQISRSGSNGQDIIANDNLEGGRPTVTLTRGQDFKSQDCGTWTKVG